MGELTDLRPLARVVTIVAAVWIIAEVLLRVSMTSVAVGAFGAGRSLPVIHAVGLFALVQIASYIATVIVTGRWTWRANTNAHALATGMSITPGWAVGWFFVPIANLFKPFEAMRECWQVSRDPNQWPLVPVPALLRWWWGCWIASNIGANLSWQLSRAGIEPGSLAWVDVLATMLAVAAGVLLIRLTRALSAAQARAMAAQAFV